MDREKWNEDEIRKTLQNAGEKEPLPENLSASQIEQRLKEADTADKKRQKKVICKWRYGMAAVVCVLLTLLAIEKDLFFLPTTQEQGKIEQVESTKEGTTYEALYENFLSRWKEKERSAYGMAKGEVSYETTYESSKESKMSLRENGSSTESAEDTSGAEITKDYGKTNQQEVNVEEADIIKNDGRYLYQIVSSKSNSEYAVQIVDTKGDLKEESRIEGFQDIQEFYVWKNRLVILESRWADTEQISNTAKLYDVADLGGAFTRIHIYDIKKREKPKELHTFTVKGDYRDSRISDGYFYFFAQDYAKKPEKEEDYKAYIPTLDDQPIEEKRIYLPEDTDADSYLVMASVNMEKPDKFVDTKAIVSSVSQFYVSEKNIYMTDSLQDNVNREGKNSNYTKIYRFSYKKGKIKKEAEGKVKGILKDDMALNEYKDHLRMVTTVDTWRSKKVKDDIFLSDFGYETTDYQTSNSLYVLDKDLKVTGKIEDLAQDEEVYSARFFGDTGYFVTFRKMDPLFSVNLSDPKKPKILGELKISGFSEYLHFYSDTLLLGIGMEAEEESGRTQGMKLSMFDITNPSDVKETSKLNLSEYDSSQALYNYKAVLIDTQKNLFGFLAEGYGEKTICDYLLFTYEEGAFRQCMKIDCADYEKYAGELRGTYIGEYFYLLCRNGRIEAYRLENGDKTDELVP
ncbi:MAG: hypothetical protein HFI37_08955 [Lachnospiraceae bacterium]|nr:hypothetical protein [Lachnospiraceae bacterium]